MPTSALESHANPVIAPDGLRTDLRYFFVGATRMSGANLLGRMLNTHPELYCGTGATIVSGDGHRCSVDHWLDDGALDRWLARPSVGAWAGDRGLDRAQLQRDIRRAAGEAVMRRSVFGCDRKKPNIRWVGDVSLFAYAPQAHRLRELFPSSVFISIVRDGRDSTVSGAFALLDTPSRFKEFDEHERAALERIRTWFVDGEGEPTPLLPDFLVKREAEIWNVSREGAAHARSVYGDRFIEIRYEDLIADRARLAGIFSMLAVEAGDGVIDAASDCIRRAEGMPAGSGISGEWRQHFSDSNKRVFKEASGQRLVEAGYESASDW